MLYLNNLNENSGENFGNESESAAEAVTVEQTSVNKFNSNATVSENVCGGAVESNAIESAGDEERFAEETPIAGVYGEIYDGVTDLTGQSGIAGGKNNLVKEYFSAPKEKIKEVADVFGEPEEKIMEEYKAFKAKKLFKRLDYFITDLPFSDENFKNACLIADKYSMFGVTVLPTAVAGAKSVLSGKAEVRAIISYPYGEDIFKVKLKAVKEAVKRGADGIAVVMSAGAIIGGDFKTLVKEIKSYVKAAKKRRLTVAMDSSKLTPLQTENCCAAIKSAGGVYSAAVFSSEAGAAVRFDAVKDVVNSLDKTVRVEAIGEVATLDGAIDYFKNGVNGLTSKNGGDIAEDVENKINIKTA